MLLRRDSLADSYPKPVSLQDIHPSHDVQHILHLEAAAHTLEGLILSSALHQVGRLEQAVGRMFDGRNLGVDIVVAAAAGLLVEEAVGSWRSVVEKIAVEEEGNIEHGRLAGLKMEAARIVAGLRIDVSHVHEEAESYTPLKPFLAGGAVLR